MKKDFAKILKVLDEDGSQIYGMLYHLVLNEKVAEELFQDLFLKLSEYKHIDNIIDLNAYAKKIAINLAFDWRKKNKAAVALDSIREPITEGSPLGEMISEEDLQVILEAIGKVKGLSREVFVLHYLEDKTYAEIGEELDKDVHQVRALCHKALKVVRKLAGKNYGKLIWEEEL